MALFVKRAKAARFDLTNQLGPDRSRSPPALLEADARGRWGTERDFGGRYVPETLMSALLELETHVLRRPPRPNLLGRAARAAHQLRRPAHAALSGRPSRRKRSTSTFAFT